MSGGIPETKAELIKEIWQIEDFLERAYKAYEAAGGKKVKFKPAKEKKPGTLRQGNRCMRDKTTIRHHCGACGKPYPKEVKP